MRAILAHCALSEELRAEQYVSVIITDANTNVTLTIFNIYVAVSICQSLLLYVPCVHQRHLIMESDTVMLGSW